MKLKNLILIFILFLSISQQVTAQSVKGLYVNDFKNIVGDIAAEDELLSFAQDSGFNYLILYNLYFIHNNDFDITDPITAAPLADFIQKAKTVYGINEVAGVGETYNSFNTIHDYNMDHISTPLQQIDVYNIEFEFWNTNTTSPGEYYCTTYLVPNGLPCDTAGAFTFYLDQMCQLDSLCSLYNFVISETYIGNPTTTQCSQLAECTDRVLVHYYRTSDLYNSGNSIYNYKPERIEALANSSNMSNVMPIFACTEEFMGPWLETHPQDQAMDTWLNGLNGYNDVVASWQENTNVMGHVWYRYTCMNDTTDVTTSNFEQQFNSELLVYPNPASFSLSIKGESVTTNSSLTILNQMGQTLEVDVISRKENQIDISVINLPVGIYWVKLNGVTTSFLKIE